MPAHRGAPGARGETGGAGRGPDRLLFLDAALLPGGWARDVALDVAGGDILSVAAGASPAGREHLPGVALPGLPNLHSHTFQRGMAGLAETRGPEGDTFWTWRQVMYAFLDRLSPDDVEAIAAFAMMEMLEGGFTAVAEFHYLHHDPAGRPYADPAELSARVAAAAARTGIGLTLLPSLYAQGGFGGAPAQPGQRRFLNGVERFLRLLDAARRAVAPVDDAAVGIAPHSLRAVSLEALRDLLAAVPDGPVHIHAAEQVREVEECLAWSGRRPVAWLLDNAPVDRRWCLVHATHMDPVEVQGVAASGAVVGLCPITEASLGDGIFPGAAFLGAGGRVGVGTDSNVDIAAPGELRQLEYSQRLAHRARNVLARGPGASTGRSLYDAALAGGAQALGRRIGRLEPGYRADLVVLDAAHPGLAAARDDRRLDAYVFAAGTGAIERVIVAGRTLVAGGRHREREAIAARYASTVARLAA